GAVARPRAAAADPAGGGELPAARPLGGRPGPVPLARGDRAAEPHGPGAGVPQPARAGRRARRGHGGAPGPGGGAAGRGGRGVRGRQPRPHAGRAVRPLVRHAGRQRPVPAAGTTGRHPAGPAMSVITYREALRNTLRAELARDDAVFLMGEEIGVFEGSYKITAGLLAEF